MSIMDLNKPAETVAQPVFRLHGIPYYPKHLNAKGEGRHKWVGPGREHERKEYTTTELTELGAELVTRQLWKRSWTDEVQGWINI
jgi:hypothetical protein